MEPFIYEKDLLGGYCTYSHVIIKLGWKWSHRCVWAEIWVKISNDNLKSNFAYVIMQSSPQCAVSMVMFPHELKNQAFLIIYCHWERCFGWLPTVWPRWIPCAHLCIRVCTMCQLPSKPVIRGTGPRRWFIHKRASFNYSQIRSHRYPGGAAAVQRQWAIRSEPRGT